MAFRFFTVPVREPEPAQEELNSFLQSHKVLSIDRRWVDQGADSFWSICVDYHASGTKGSSSSRGKKSQVDYREVLNEDDFAVFSALRELRKQIAQQESVAVYQVFTNEQLAEMVTKRAATKADLEKIVGAGSARLKKYGEPFVDALSKQWSNEYEANRNNNLGFRLALAPPAKVVEPKGWTEQTALPSRGQLTSGRIFTRAARC